MGDLIQITDKRGSRRARASLGHPDAARQVNLADYQGMTSDRALLSIAQEGVRLADMLPDQKATVAVWLRNEAGKAFWRSQQASATDEQRQLLLDMREQMIERAVAIEAGL